MITIGPLRATGEPSASSVRLVPPTRAPSLTRLGDIQAAASNTEAATDTWHEALAILDNLAHPEASQIRSKLRKVSENAELGSR